MADPVGVLLVGLGGSVGALGRFAVGRRIETDGRDTLTVNVLGSLLLGVLTGAPVAETALLLVGVGFCGAFTTFSTAAVETVELADERPLVALRRIAVMLVAALVAVLVGQTISGVAG